MSYTGEIERDGFAIIENAVDTYTLTRLEKDLQHLEIDHLASQRMGKAFGLRNLTC